MKKQANDYLDDRDLMISPGPGLEPLYMVRRLGCYATMLVFPLSWAAIGALFVWQEWPFVLWPFVTGPLVIWTIALALPMFLKFRRGALVTLDALIRTSEAWLARAGFVVDLNSDGIIGHARPEIKPPIQDVRPIIFRGRGLREEHKSGPRLPAPAPYADQAADRVGAGAGLPDLEEEPSPVRVKVWHLPNREKIHQAQLEEFIDGIFSVGWNRVTWLEKGITREQYDGLIQLLERAQLLTDRKRGYAGRLNVRNARQARAVLDLPRDPS